jgi:hypothetical protein
MLRVLFLEKFFEEGGAILGGHFRILRGRAREHSVTLPELSKYLVSN